jgi:hypothetical protein
MQGGPSIAAIRPTIASNEIYNAMENRQFAAYDGEGPRLPFVWSAFLRRSLL